MKVAVIGSRTFTDKKLLEEELDKLNIELLISGGAQGADTLAENYARERNISVLIFKPDYQRHGKGAPLVRNKEIVNHAEIIVAFWDKKSRGTKFTVDYAKNKQLPVIQVIF